CLASSDLPWSRSGGAPHGERSRERGSDGLCPRGRQALQQLTIGSQRNLGVRVGFVSEIGKRPANEDYVGACLGQAKLSNRDVVAAVADGVGGYRGGREAAEIAVRCFIDAYYSLPETMGVRRRASRALEAANSWIYAQGHNDERLAGMSCAFSSAILSR